ncbi:thiosulfate/3-mercaptopyruvate sulfurtransferase [Breoghania corrubedonensis]|uniref:Sulfurtransferase n=1 Tax=Breoghania corrubedonensis TaxID=665038 RepID=A0A2T5VBH2_9HYPH|nr:3-mercaptopyruvate sulfurtransferase [Breoghania corrubedonensis]PTW61102.1 thiosulfate/3-mercaptopyruvate sulfurtransferase [Breoghania corrubedonensis]
MDRRNLVSTDWLQDHLHAPDVVVLDGSWHMPAENRDPKREYLDAHIPGALFFDIDAIADTSSDLPHMLPSAAAFSSMMRKMGIGDGQTIVAYDSLGLISARVWWMFKAMGAEHVYVLDGGLPKWQAEDRPLETGEVSRPERHFTARLNHAVLRDIDDMRIASANGTQIVDARSRARFDAQEPEPRPGLRGGHIPGSINVHYKGLLESENRLKPTEGLAAVFREAGVDPAQQVITTCGSGVTAAILALALDEIGARHVAVYDGSWTEWGGDPDTPIEP